jgi:hypothetical protein
MSLRLTPELIAAFYDALRLAEPFRAWKLPPSGECRFKVNRNPKVCADFAVVNGVPTYRISALRNGHLSTALSSVCHEMLHHRQAQTCDREVHGPRFQKMAAKVCAVFGFDPKMF